MMEHKLITKLIDFYLEIESPLYQASKKNKRQSMGSNYASPPFENILLCISYIARQQDYIDLSSCDHRPLYPNGEKPRSIGCLNFSGERVPPLVYDDIYMLS